MQAGMLKALSRIDGRNILIWYKNHTLRLSFIDFLTSFFYAKFTVITIGSYYNLLQSTV